MTFVKNISAFFIFLIIVYNITIIKCFNMGKLIMMSDNLEGSGSDKMYDIYSDSDSESDDMDLCIYDEKEGIYS